MQRQSEKARLPASQTLRSSGGLINMSTLTPERWHEVSPYLDEALSLGDDERTRWLDDLHARMPEREGSTLRKASNGHYANF